LGRLVLAEVVCGSCAQSVPSGRFCVRCGAVLGGDPAAAVPSVRRAEFAAAPHERLGSPRLISTIFPQLPRASMNSFRIALAAGVAVVVLLGALRLFPAALVAAAALVPILTVLYLIDVDVYEDEPARVILLTVAWGAASGIAAGVLAKTIAPTGVDLLTRSTGSAVAVQGVLLPLLGMVLMLVGPLALLRYRRFNDVLDGVTFGAACAASFAGAEAVTYGISLIASGPRPMAETGPWIVRLLTVAVATPVLTMAAIGATAGAFWLRYRAPLRDRGELGALGNPFVAVPTAATLIVLAAGLQPLLPTGLWLLVLFGLDVIALAWLRWAIHLGLLEEASEIGIGPPFTCANCGEETPRHTFCVHCGISLQALPKAGASATIRRLPDGASEASP
jgi:RsiW-degrading membrane proteinase PrsW (M82 family)